MGMRIASWHSFYPPSAQPPDHVIYSRQLRRVFVKLGETCLGNREFFFFCAVVGFLCKHSLNQEKKREPEGSGVILSVG